jgi:hypothetical protein
MAWRAIDDCKGCDVFSAGRCKPAQQCIAGSGAARVAHPIFDVDFLPPQSGTDFEARDRYASLRPAGDLSSFPTSVVRTTSVERQNRPAIGASLSTSGVNTLDCNESVCG